MGRKKPKEISIPIASAPSGGAGQLSWILIAVAIALFVLTRSYILLEFEPQFTDVPLYFKYAATAIDLHQIPYQENLEVEYPPLAWWTICLPRLLNEHRITRPQDPRQIAPILTAYCHAFRGLMFICDLASVAVLWLIVWKQRPQMTGWAVLLYTVTTAILGHLLYDRLDMGLLALFLLSVYCWIRSLDASGRTIIWTVAAYTLLGLSISYKVIPVICVPFLLLSELHAPAH